MTALAGQQPKVAVIIGIIIIIVTVTVIAGAATTNLVLLPQQSYASAPPKFMGERFFANGTGVAYFDHGTITRPFTHTIKPEYGFYYDNSSAFVAGDVPGVGVVVAFDTNYKGYINASEMVGGKTVNISIPFDIDNLPAQNQTFQPNVAYAKVGDRIKITNEDWRNTFIISSPPEASTSRGRSGDDSVKSGLNFGNIGLSPGEPFSMIATNAGGIHYNSMFNSTTEMTGTIIITEK